MSDLRSSLENAEVPRRWWRWVAAAVGVVVVAGIGVAVARSGGSGADADTDKPVRGGTLQFALIDYQRSPDPPWGTNYAESLIGNNVTDKLTWQDPRSGEIMPWRGSPGSTTTSSPSSPSTCATT
jgi:peptide/nickel transport system substrate-binding protein